MDPTQTLLDALDNLAIVNESQTRLREGHVCASAEMARRVAVENLRDLADWLERRGFAPNVSRFGANACNAANVGTFQVFRR